MRKHLYRKLSRALAALVGVAMLCGAALPCAEAESVSRAEALLGMMTLEQKIGQLFIVRPEALWMQKFAQGEGEKPGYSETKLTDTMRAGLDACPVGGIAIFGQNLKSPKQLKKLIGDFQAASAIPLFIAVDEEGGSVARLGNSDAFDVPRVGAMAKVGESGDPRDAYDAGHTIGTYLSEYGFNLDFAPVADVNTNPDNVVIGNRAFGSDPALVAQMVPAALAGLHDAGVMGCIKHFPGHGDTSGDTHEGYVSVSKNWDELMDCELLPFRAALNETDLVMMAHITVPNVTDDGLPASLSQQMIEGKLRGELGYGGAVITDALGMGAVADNYSAGDAAVLALRAGVDILLMPESLSQAFKAIRDAIEGESLPLARLDEAVLRILKLKERYGLLPT